MSAKWPYCLGLNVLKMWLGRMFYTCYTLVQVLILYLVLYYSQRLSWGHAVANGNTWVEPEETDTTMIKQAKGKVISHLYQVLYGILTIIYRC